jgi:FKBP-type peptidyl-prolyl cis-trans isomerase FkpA
MGSATISFVIPEMRIMIRIGRQPARFRIIEAVKKAMRARSSLVVGFVAVAFAVGVMLNAAGCSKKVDELPPSGFTAASAPPLPPGPEKLEKVDEVVGTGQEAKTGDKVRVHYTGTLMNGKQFDSSVGKDPFEFELGKGGVIKGWDEGVPGMKVGGKRKLTIPYQLAYGEAGSGEKIPPKAALKFDIELLEIVGPGGADGGAAKGDAGAAKKKDEPKKDAGK